MDSEVLIRITPDKAIEFLRKDGIDASTEEAQIILEFLYSMANIVVEQYVNNRRCDAVTVTQESK